ncbi:alpha/beta fold hydrolase [Vibrio algicola]|uniref:alpha/beta fold hydrolase n=1 Tax=Vibrio algicola TaxID=2662262 RepID=UPI001CEC9AF2|nr:alpha/beta hydrolase [Vibrio algicola]
MNLIHVTCLQETRISLPHLCLAGLEHSTAQDADISVVFIHGWLDNAASFTSLLEQLPPSIDNNKMHYLAIDLPGHGLSQHKSTSNFYPFHDYISDIQQLLRQIAPKNLILVGHSLGALIASCYSAAFPENVLALIQIEGLGPLAESADNSVQRLRKGILNRQRFAAKPLRGYDSKAQALQHRMHANQLSADQLEPLITRGCVFDGERWQWRYDPKLRCDSLYRMTQDQALNYLEAVVCPNLLILGTEGYPAIKQATQRIPSLTNIQQVEVEGGHHCHLQQPHKTAQLIEQFIQQFELDSTITKNVESKCDSSK